MSRLLDVAAVDAGYGRSRVLFGVTLHVDEGESVALVGRNGMGKTTTIRTIMGLCDATAGHITRSRTSPRTASRATASAWSPKAAKSSRR